MKKEQPTRELGRELRRLREQRDFSIRGLAEAADVDATWLSRLERGLYANPDPRLLRNVADALDVGTAGLFVAAGFEDAGDLPHFAMYLRTKYDLPDEAIEALEAHFRLFDERVKREADHG